jgi:iron-sulfur cluster assembly protein
MNLELTEKAADRIRKQIAQRGKGIGQRVGVRKSGCSGYAYTMDYADEIGESDLVFEHHGVKVVIDRKNLPYLDGSTLDYRREGLNEMFSFDNPNVADECGCGESFAV